MGLVKARSVAEVAVAAGTAYLTDDVRIVVDVRANPQSSDDWGFAFRASSGVGKKDSPSHLESSCANAVTKVCGLGGRSCIPFMSREGYDGYSSAEALEIGKSVDTLSCGDFKLMHQHCI